MTTKKAKLILGERAVNAIDLCKSVNLAKGVLYGVMLCKDALKLTGKNKKEMSYLISFAKWQFKKARKGKNII